MSSCRFSSRRPSPRAVKLEARRMSCTAPFLDGLLQGASRAPTRPPPADRLDSTRRRPPPAASAQSQVELHACPPQLMSAEKKISSLTARQTSPLQLLMGDPVFAQFFLLTPVHAAGAALLGAQDGRRLHRARPCVS